MQSIRLAVEETACVILERLGEKLSDAELDYESFAGVHNFIIDHAGTRFRVQFTEQTLLGKSAEELEHTIHKVAEQVLSNSTVRQLQYRNCNGRHGPLPDADVEPSGSSGADCRVVTAPIVDCTLSAYRFQASHISIPGGQI